MSTRSQKQEKVEALRGKASTWRACGTIMLGAVAGAAPQEVWAVREYLNNTAGTGQAINSVVEGLFVLASASFFLGAHARRHEADAIEASLKNTRLRNYQPTITSVPRENLPFAASIEPQDATPLEPHDAVPPAPIPITE